MLSSWYLCELAHSQKLTFSVLITNSCRLRRVEFLSAAFAPIAVILVVNLLAFMHVIRIVFKRLPHDARSKHKRKSADLKRQVRLTVATMALLGLTWTLGFLMVGYRHVSLHYIFALLNSFLGFFIVFLNVFLRERVRTKLIEAWKRISCLRKEPPDSRRPSKANLISGHTSNFPLTANTVVQARDALQPISMPTRTTNASDKPACIIHCNQSALPAGNGKPKAWELFDLASQCALSLVLDSCLVLKPVFRACSPGNFTH